MIDNTLRCRQYKHEISDREARANQGLCDECAFSTDATAQVSQVAATIVAMRAAVAEVPSYVERYQRLAAFELAFLQERGVYAAFCDLPEDLALASIEAWEGRESELLDAFIAGVSGEEIEQEQDDFDPNGPVNEPVPALSFDWQVDEDDYADPWYHPRYDDMAEFE